MENINIKIPSFEELNFISEWVDYSDNITENSLFFFISPITRNLEYRQKRALQLKEQLLKIDFQFYLCAVDVMAMEVMCHYLQDLKNIKIIGVISHLQYKDFVLKKYYLKPKKIIGVTGTSGKTSCIYLLNHIYNSNNIKSAAIGSIVNELNKKNEMNSNMSTSFMDYHKFLHESVINNIEVCILECSNFAIDQERLYGIRFDLVILTSFSLDHLSLYSNIMDYFYCKLSIINYLKKDGKILFNSDISLFNTNIPLLYEQYDYYGISFKNLPNSFSNDFKLNNQNKLIDFYCDYEDKKLIIHHKKEIIIIDINNKLQHFLHMNNLITGYSAFYLMENKWPQDISEKEIPGRFNIIKHDNNIIIVDYCHNPEKYQYFFYTLKTAIEKNFLPNKKIIVMGGLSINEIEIRYKQLDWMMKKVDTFILTWDNMQNNEIFKKCLDQLLLNSEIIYIPNRMEAIEFALKNYCNEENIVCFLGIGISKSLQINGIIHQYDEFKIIQNYLENLKK